MLDFSSARSNPQACLVSSLLRFCTVRQAYQELAECSHGSRVKIHPKHKFAIELPSFVNKKLSLGPRSDFRRHSPRQAGYLGWKIMSRARHGVEHPCSSSVI